MNAISPRACTRKVQAPADAPGSCRASTRLISRAAIEVFDAWTATPRHLVAHGDLIHAIHLLNDAANSLRVYIR